MSTRVDNGIKFKSKNWKEILDQLLSIKDDAIEISKKLITKEKLELFISANKLYDKDHFYIFSELECAVSTRSSKYSFIPNIRFSVVLYPTNEGDIYGVYFNSNQNKYFKLMESFVEDFHYQDSSDKPDDISEEDWEYRMNKWDKLVPGSFSRSGFIYELVSASDLSDLGPYIRNDIKEILPSIIRDNKLKNIGIN